MKKILLVVSLAFAVMTASAQLYVGGALGFKSDGAWKDKDGNKWGDSYSKFGILPEVGYSLNDKFDVGITLGFTSETTTGWFDNDKTGSEKYNVISVSPYVRYSFVEFGKFSLLGKAALNVGIGSGKDLDDKGKEIDGSSYGSTELGFAITPVVLYSLSDRVCLYTNLNFAGLNFTSTTLKDDGEKYASFSKFGIGANTNSAFNLGNIEVGFVISF